MAPDQDDLFQFHRPVMVSEVLWHLFADIQPTPGEPWVVDGTVGPGGHAEAVLAAQDDVHVLGLDRDPDVLVLARERLAPYAGRVRLRHASHADVERVLEDERLDAPSGVLLDLGASSWQLDDPDRGFSFRTPSVDADMRFDRTGDGPTALDLVNHVSERELSRIVHEYGEEPRARAVARALVNARPVKDGAHLVEVVRGSAWRTRRHDAATRTFQALRIAVNDELGHVQRGIEAALRVVRPAGRVVVISFHSGEDRIAKNVLRDAARAGQGAIRTKKPQRPTEEEVHANRRARPARLRAFEKALDDGGERER